MLRTTSILSLLTLTLAAQEAQGHDLWVQDFAKAKATAKAEGKDLLVDFTGSDWCGWCIRLDQEVFSQEAFTTAAPKSFVLVKLDYPQDESLVTDEIRAQNEKLQGEYGIQGFPTILLMDHEGRVFAKTGYEEGGPEKYLENLDAMRKSGTAYKTAIAAAADKQGGERAKALDAALATLDEEVAGTYHFATMEEILGLDADGKQGLKAKYEERVAKIREERQFNEAVQELNRMVGEHMQNGEGEKALAALDEVIKAPKNVMRHQLALFFKGMVIMDTSGDAKAAIEALEAGMKLAPDSRIGQRIKQVIPEIQKQLEDQGEEKEGEEVEVGGK